MALGPGKYDQLCTYVREQAEAEAAVILVFGGSQGSGFSAQASAEVTRQLPAILERLARDIRESINH